jgi:hypothetical protein
MFKRACQFSLMNPGHALPFCLRFMFILSCHLWLRLQSSLLPLCFPTKTVNTFFLLQNTFRVCFIIMGWIFYVWCHFVITSIVLVYTLATWLLVMQTACLLYSRIVKLLELLLWMTKSINPKWEVRGSSIHLRAIPSSLGALLDGEVQWKVQSVVYC